MRVKLERNLESPHAEFGQAKHRHRECHPLVYTGLVVGAAVLLVAGAWVAFQRGVEQPAGALGEDDSSIVNTVAPRKSGEEKPVFKIQTSCTKTSTSFAPTVGRVSEIWASVNNNTRLATKTRFQHNITALHKASSTSDDPTGAAIPVTDTSSRATGPSSAKEFRTDYSTAASVSAEGKKTTGELFLTSNNGTPPRKIESPKGHGIADFTAGMESPALSSHSHGIPAGSDEANEGTIEIYAKATSRAQVAGDVKSPNLSTSTTAVIHRRSLNTDDEASWSVTSSAHQKSVKHTIPSSASDEIILVSQSTKLADEMMTVSATIPNSTVGSTASTASESSSPAVAAAKAMDPQALLCTYGAKTNASTLFPGDGLCDLIFFDSAYKNDRNFPAESASFGLGLQHFLSVTPKYRKTAFGVGFAFEYRGILTQDLTRTDPVILDVFWKHDVFHFGILDVPVFGLKPYYMDDVFMCLKTLDGLSKRHRDLGKAAYVVLSAVPYNAGWVNYVAEKMKTVYQPDLFVSQGHYTYGDNEAITCAVVPPTSLFRPSKLLGYAHDLNTAALALRQLETQGASTRWSISVGMKGRLAAPLPKFPLEMFSPCAQNPIAPAFDAYTEVCNNQDLWQRPAYDTKHHAMLSRSTKRDMMFVYDNEESLCRKLCRLKANYTKLRFGLAAFDLDYEDYSNSCRHDNKFSAFSRLQTLRKLVDYFKSILNDPFDESGCVALVPMT